MLVHGWPDAARSWDRVRDALAGDGYRVLIPDLRGHGSTRFRADEAVLDGSAEALARDVLDLADGSV